VLLHFWWSDTPAHYIRAGRRTTQPLREGVVDPSKPIVYNDFLAAQTEVVHHQKFAPILYVLISDDPDEAIPLNKAVLQSLHC